MQTDPSGNPILDQFSDEGFVDCVLRIVESSETSMQYQLRLAASFAGEVVGMNVVVVKGIQAGIDAEMNLIKEHVYRRGVIFRRSGPESDRLISAIAALYRGMCSDARMIDEEPFTAIALHQGALDMAQQPVKLKLFGRDSEPFDEEAYYESFFNLDLPNGLVYWNEKDPDYRAPLVRSLAV